MKPKEKQDALFILVQNLTKSEKRLFTIFMGRFDNNKDAEFLHLFKSIERMKYYDETTLIKKHGYSKTQLANFKGHLYRQILLSLRLSPKNLNLKQTLYEQFTTASILHEKGLFDQSLKVLKKILETGRKNNEHFICSEALELQKTIASQYLKKDSRKVFKELIGSSEEELKKERILVRLSNFSLKLYRAYMQFGAVKNEQEHDNLVHFFDKNMPKVRVRDLGFYGRLHYYQCRFWYAVGTQDFLSCYRYSSQWVDLFYNYKEQIAHNYVYFFKAHYYLFDSLFFIRSHKKLRAALDQLERFVVEEELPLSQSSEHLLSYHLSIAKVNLHFLKGTFKEGLLTVNQIVTQTSIYQSVLGAHKMMVMHYKIACLYFGAGDNLRCIEFLTKVLGNKNGSQDLLCFSKFLNLIAHYEEGLDYHLELLIKDTYKYLLKLNELNKIQRRIISFFRSLKDVLPVDLKHGFAKLLEDLRVYSEDPFERRTFLYLDIISWLEGKVQGIPIDQIMQSKRLDYCCYIWSLFLNN